MIRNPMIRSNAVLPAFRFNERAGQFIRANGRFVSPPEVRAALDRYLQAKVSAAAEMLWGQVREGALTLAEFQLAAEREIALAALAAGMLAKGGRLQMSPADYGRVGGFVKPMLGEWRDAAKRVAEGALPFDGRLKNALRGLLQRARQVFHRVEGLEMTRRGFDECENVLDDGLHHCRATEERSSCPEVTAQGFTSTEARVEIGLRGCYGNCLCRWRYRNSGTGEMRG